MKTYLQVEAMVYRMVDDATESIYTDSLIYDGIEAAHYAICPWVPKMSVHTLTSGSSPHTLDTYVLPTDVFDILAIRENDTELLLPNATLDSNSIFGSTYTDDKSWIYTPDGYLTLSWEETSGNTLKLFYMASWTCPTYEDKDTATLEIPNRAILGAAYFAASHCMAAQSSGTSLIRQFNIRIDSGTPIHNPIMDSSKFLYDMFLNQMKLMPTYSRPGR